MKIFITGASGKVAEAITKILKRETDYEIVVQTTSLMTFLARSLNKIKSYEFSFTDRRRLREVLLAEKPDIIINTAAYTNVDACEDDKKGAWDVNVKPVETMVKVANKIGAKLIHFSTDYIFDGAKGPYSEYDMPNPVSYYGKSKLAADNAILGEAHNYSIIRTNVVYGPSTTGKNDFVRWVMESLMSEKKIRLINGQFCNPTFTDDIAYGVLKIIEKNAKGIYNFAGADYLNRYQCGLVIAKAINIDPKLIEEQNHTEFLQKAKRPHLGGLINLKAETELGVKFCGLESGVISTKVLMKY